MVFSLLENPQESKRLQENQNSLIKPAIEETLRYRLPVQFLIRTANVDVILSEGRKEGERKEIKKVKNLYYIWVLPPMMNQYLQILNGLILLVKTCVI